MRFGRTQVASLEAFNEKGGGIVIHRGDKRSRPIEWLEGRVDYRFNLNEPLEPQLEKARKALVDLQTKQLGKKIYRRPRRERWPLYLRVLDARDCGASWQKIGGTLWPRSNGNVKDKARQTYELAIAVRDNFPI